MQLSNLKRSAVWYFIFGPPEKSSLALQFATEHKLVHLNVKNSHESTFRDHLNSGLVAQCPPVVFRQVQALKTDIFVIILEGNLSSEQLSIKKDYQRIGRCVNLKSANYKSMRKELYPKLIVLFGPKTEQIQFICQSYFNFSGYKILRSALTSNDLISKLPKEQSYILTGFVPQLSQLNILQQFFNVQVVHFKYQRTELNNHEDFFNLEATIIPSIGKKSYYHAINGNNLPAETAAKIGQQILPELIFVEAHDQQQRKVVLDYIHKTDGLLLSMDEIDSIHKKRQVVLKSGIQKLQDLVTIIFKNSYRKQIFLIDYPQKPQDFFILKDKTRTISLFADCTKSQKYQLQKHLTPAIYFLETQQRKHIQLDFSFQKQIMKNIKYIVINGPPCVGKTSAAKYISSSFGYKHIQYEAYIASIKEKLIAPEDGQDLPFHKIIKHFQTLISNSGENPILIDGLNLDWKHIDNWVALNGPPVVFNLKTDEKELIRRTRRKNQADVNAEITQEQGQKAKEAIAKNTDWADQLTARCPASTLYQIDFSPQLILAEKLIDQILKPRVFLVQDNNSFLYQNIALKHNLGYFDFKKSSLREIAVKIRLGNYRNVLLNNYNQKNEHLVCQDFHQIQKQIGSIRYLAIWSPEAIEANDQKLHLQAPAKVQKPKPAQGEQGGQAPPPAQEEGEAKKKAFNIFDYSWTKPGNQKNISQWLFKLKKNVARHQKSQDNCFSGFEDELKTILENKDVSIYDLIVG